MYELKINNNKQKEKIKVKAQNPGTGRAPHLSTPYFLKPDYTPPKNFDNIRCKTVMGAENSYENL